MFSAAAQIATSTVLSNNSRVALPIQVLRSAPDGRSELIMIMIETYAELVVYQLFSSLLFQVLRSAPDGHSARLQYEIEIGRLLLQRNAHFEPRRQRSRSPRYLEEDQNGQLRSVRDQTGAPPQEPIREQHSVEGKLRGPIREQYSFFL